METLIVLLVLFLLAIPIVAIAGVVMAVGTRERLRLVERELVLLQRRLDELPAAEVTQSPQRPPEQSLPQPVAPEPPALPEPISVPAAADQSPRETAPEPPAPAAPKPEPKPDRDLPPTSEPARPAMGFEERFGTQWVVWVGGLALAHGGFFLVRYSVQQGLIGPGVRVTLGALLAIALIAAGEWTRRNDLLAGIAGLPSAHIPSILTAVGTTIAYADVYAAYALYGFLAPAAAFLLLGVVALATLAAALLHGPELAGLGLVGAYVTPLLVVQIPIIGAYSIWRWTAVPFALGAVARWLAITAIAGPCVGVPGAYAAHAGAHVTSRGGGLRACGAPDRLDCC